MVFRSTTSTQVFFGVSLCLKANAEMVPKIPSYRYMLLMWPSRLKFSSNQFHVLYACKITTATGKNPIAVNKYYYQVGVISRLVFVIEALFVCLFETGDGNGII